MTFEPSRRYEPNEASREDGGAPLTVERSGQLDGGAYLGMADGDAWLTPEQTRNLRDQLTEILGEEPATPEPALSPVATARLEVVRQLVELGVEAGDVPAILDAVAGELPGGVAVRRLGSREPDYWIAPERGCSVDFTL